MKFATPKALSKDLGLIKKAVSKKFGRRTRRNPFAAASTQVRGKVFLLRKKLKAWL